MISFFSHGAFFIPLAIISLTSMIHVCSVDSTEADVSVLIGRALEDIPAGTDPAMCFRGSKDRGDPDFLNALKTYHFYSCIGKVEEGSPCTCMLTRTLTLPWKQIVAIYPNEYHSMSECNSICGRGRRDKCWFCDEEQVFTGDGSIQLVKSCKHVQDVLPSVVPTNLRFIKNACFRRCNNLVEAECSLNQN